MLRERPGRGAAEGCGLIGAAKLLGRPVVARTWGHPTPPKFVMQSVGELEDFALRHLARRLDNRAFQSVERGGLV